jgi:hypothetical protein
VRGPEIDIVLLYQFSRNPVNRASQLRLLPDEARCGVQLVDELGAAIQHQHFTIHLA